MDIMKSEAGMKDLVWLIDSKSNLLDFPQEVRRKVGYALRFAQAGLMSEHAKPFKGVASGVFEIVEDFRTDSYRSVYAVKLGNTIYVLHSFQKKSKSGIKTPQKEIDLIKARYKLAKEMGNAK